MYYIRTYTQPSTTSAIYVLMFRDHNPGDIEVARFTDADTAYQALAVLVDLNAAAERGDVAQSRIVTKRET